MSDLTKKLRDTERALKLERETVQRISRQRDQMAAEVERLRADNNHQRERRNSARDAIDKGKAERKAIEQERDQALASHDAAIKNWMAASKERDQLGAALQRFMELDSKDPDVDGALWCLQQEEAANGISLARRDAEVIERFKDELVKSVSALYRPHIEGVCAVVQQQLRQQIKESAK